MVRYFKSIYNKIGYELGDLQRQNHLVFSASSCFEVQIIIASNF